jgi:hypothetical protein
LDFERITSIWSHETTSFNLILDDDFAIQFLLDSSKIVDIIQKKKDSIIPIQNRFLWHPRYNSRFTCNRILDVSWPSMQLPLSSCASIFDKCLDLRLCSNCACGQSSPHLLLHLWFIEWYQHWSHGFPTSYLICIK